MTTYRTIAATETDPQAPITSALMKALDANATAIAEGDTTAPVNAACWHPYNKVLSSDSNDGKFYDFATNGVQASVETPNFDSGWEYRVRIVGLSHNNGATANFQVEPYRQTGAVYNPAHTLITAANSTILINGEIACSTPHLSLNRHIMTAALGAVSSYGNLATTLTTYDIAPEFTTVQRIGKLRISFSAGSIDAGQMFLDKRRAYS